MEIGNEAMEAAARIAARAGVTVEDVLRAYMKAAQGAAVNAQMLFLEPTAKRM